MAVHLMTEPCGARLPMGKQMVEERPLRAGAIGRHDYIVGIDAVLLAEGAAQGMAAGTLAPPVETWRRGCRRWRL